MSLSPSFPFPQANIKGKGKGEAHPKKPSVFWWAEQDFPWVFLLRKVNPLFYLPQWEIHLAKQNPENPSGKEFIICPALSFLWPIPRSSVFIRIGPEKVLDL